jgi:hypothetical protein
MNRQRQESSYESNGLAKDTETKYSTNTSSGINQSEVQGFLSLTAGIILLLAPKLFPEILMIAVTITALGLIIYGGRKAHVITRAQELFQSIRSRS